MSRIRADRGRRMLLVFWAATHKDSRVSGKADLSMGLG